MPDVTTSAAASSDPPDPARLALLRAVPLTRMVDTGVDLGRAQRIVARFESGAQFDSAALVEVDELRKALAGCSPRSARELTSQIVATLAIAQLAYNFDTPAKRELYRSLGEAISELAALSPDTHRVVDIPYRAASMRALVVRPQSSLPPPTVIVFGGLNGWGASYLPQADALTARGLAVMLVELPGQGATRMEGSLFGDASMSDAVGACVDWVATSGELGGQVGVWGNSFGGLFAALAAGQDARLGACCVNGAPSRPQLPPFQTAQELMMAFFGVDDADAIRSVLGALAIDAAPTTIGCDLLVIHGGDDVLVSAEDQHAFIDCATGTSVWYEQPGGQHTLYNFAPERNALVGDFFARALSPAL